MNRSVKQTLDLIESLRDSGADFCVVTVVRTADATSAKAGAKAVVTQDGALHGFVGGACVSSAVRRAAEAALSAGAPRLIRVRSRDAEDRTADAGEADSADVDLYASSCPSGGTVDLFLEPMRHAPRFIVCGTSPVALALERLGRAMGYDTVLAGPAEALPEDRPDRRLHSGYDLRDLDLTPRDAVAVCTQGVRDREALVAALSSPAAYVGMVGSARKVATLLKRIGDAVSDEQKARLRGPAGLRIGAIDPEEIALSILAEVIQERRKQNAALAPTSAETMPVDA